MFSQKLTIAVASGKGGVGKSMLASGLAMLLSRERNVIAVDADVDAPNLHLWLGGIDQWDEKSDLSLTEKAKVIKPDVDCHKFKVPCQFGAISCQNNNLRVNSFLCEGCGLCQQILGPSVIAMVKVVNGQLRIKKNIHGLNLISGKLYPGETGSGKIVDEIIKKSREFKAEITLVDIPAGIGCPVTAGLKEADIVILVTEPTLTGKSDLKRILMVVNKFDLPWRLVVNKFDLNRDFAGEIQNWAGKKFLGKISYDRKIFKALSKLNPVLDTNLKVKTELEKIKARFYNGFYESN
jgi:MinD superfamily P-loop ATPase